MSLTIGQLAKVHASGRAYLNYLRNMENPAAVRGIIQSPIPPILDHRMRGQGEARSSIESTEHRLMTRAIVKIFPLGYRC